MLPWQPEFHPIGPKTICNLFPCLVMLYMKFDLKWLTLETSLVPSPRLIWVDNRVPVYLEMYYFGIVDGRTDDDDDDDPDDDGLSLAY